MRLLPSLITAIVVTSWAILAARWIAGNWGPIGFQLAGMWIVFAITITVALWRWR